MSEQSDIDPALLGRYFAGECTRAEAAAFDRWAQASPERRALVAELRKVWLTGATRPGAPLDMDAAWHKVTAQLADYRGTTTAPLLRLEPAERERRRSTGIPYQPTRAPWRWLRGPAVAAALTLAIGAGIWAAVVRHAAAPIEYASGTGQSGRRVVTLSDGTRVTLGPQSHLRVPGRIGARRDVELEGEAFFQVTHDARHPFRVHTRDAETQVLGTEFGVWAYADTPDVQVAVRTGRVAVRSTRAATGGVPGGALVTAGGRAIVRGSTIAVDRPADSAMFAWVDGPVRFESATVGEVTREMGRWIGVEIVVPSATLRATKVTVAFPDLSRDSVLTRMTTLVGARAVTGQAQTVILVPTGSPVSR